MHISVLALVEQLYNTSIMYTNTSLCTAKKTGLGDVLVAPYGRVKLKGNILLHVKLRLGSSISLLRKTKNRVIKMTNIMYGHIFIALALPERKTTCFNLTSLSLAYLGLQPVLLVYCFQTLGLLLLLLYHQKQQQKC